MDWVMGKWSGRLGYLALGLAALFVPFFTTLALIDYFAAGGSPFRSGKPVFELVTKRAGNNWSLGESKTEVKEERTGLVLVVPAREKSFGFRTDQVEPTKARNHAVQYDINVTSGALVLEVLDSQWRPISTQPLSSRRGRMILPAAQGKFVVALFNRGAVPATAMVAALTVLEEAN